jgi:hypothetical protein
MNLFTSILEKLGINKPAAPSATAPQAKPATQATGLPTIEQQLGLPPKPAAQAAAAPAPQAPPPVQAAPPKQESAATQPPVVRPPGFVAAQESHVPTIPQPLQSGPVKPAAPVAVPMVDVVSKLENLAAESKQKLDWKVSIVDMMKLLNMDSSFEARTELATELGCPPELMKESAKMNVWLHKTVLQKIAENGGNIPASLL